MFWKKVVEFSILFAFYFQVTICLNTWKEGSTVFALLLSVTGRAIAVLVPGESCPGEGRAEAFELKMLVLPEFLCASWKLPWRFLFL